MPLPKRCVEPVLVSRGTVPERHNVPSELEAVTNGTLANTVRQLSSLSKHAEDMFGELTRDASALAERANGLQARIDRLAVRVTQLDSTVEEVSLQDIQMRKAFRSSRTFTQQIFSRNTMPSAMLVTYARCEPPPPLERLNEFRDDGKDARKFYTDPGYFFELWRHDMLQDTERIQHDRGKKVRQPRAGGAGGRAGGRVRAPHSTREQQRAAAVKRGEHLMPQPTHAQQPLPYQHNADSHYRDSSVVDGGGSQYRASQLPRPTSQAQRPCSIEISEQPYRQPRLSTGNGHVMGEESPYGPGSEPIYGGSLAGTPRRARPSVPPPAPPAPLSPPTANHTPTRSALPPPPPPPEGASPPPLTNGASPPPPPQPARTTLDAHLDHMHRVMDMMRAEPEEAPPPPPPPPPPAQPQPARPAPPSAAELLLGASTLRAAPQQPPPAPDPRTDLLKAIRDGIKLRKAEQHEKIQRNLSIPAPELFDVAKIIARRYAFDPDDSDPSESEGESEQMDDAWNSDDGESNA